MDGMWVGVVTLMLRRDVMRGVPVVLDFVLHMHVNVHVHVHVHVHVNFKA